MDVIEQLLRIIAPHQCVGCGAEGRLLCSTCIAAMPAVSPRCYRCTRATADSLTCVSCSSESVLFCATAATFYAGSAKEVIHRLKFGRASAAAEDIAKLMVARLRHSDAQAVTYVPTAASRIRARGYDQARLIAKEVARGLGLPCVSLLARSGNQRQLGQSRTTRKQQMQSAFYALHADFVTDKHVLLVDDVLTTGATCESAAAVLKRAGARRISAAVFAVA